MKLYNDNDYGFRSAEKEEMRRCQMQMSEYDRQMEELKRQMTNERFDRALRDEEKRRYLSLS